MKGKIAYNSPACFRRMSSSKAHHGSEWRELDLRTGRKRIIEEMKIPDDWKKSELVTIYESKGDILECEKHRGT